MKGYSALRRILLAAMIAALALLALPALMEQSVDEPVITIKLDKSTVDISKGESFKAVASTTGGTEPYTFTYDWYVSEGSEEYELRSIYQVLSDTDTFKPLFGQSGRLLAKVTDSAGHSNTAEATYTLTGSPLAEPLSLNITLSKTTVDVSKGESTTAIIHAIGGTEPFTFSYEWYIADSVGDYSYSSRDTFRVSSNTDTFRPLFGQSGRLLVRVSDSVGRINSAEAAFTLTGSTETEPLEILATNMDKHTVDVSRGEKITVDLELAGGTKPYAYSYYWYLTEGDREYQFIDENVDSTYTFMPMFGESGLLEVIVEDSLGRKEWAYEEFSVTGSTSVPLLTLDVSLDTNAVDLSLGESVTASVTPSGGTAPYVYFFYWCVMEDGKEQTVQRREGLTGSTDTFKPEFGESGRVSVLVEDKLGRYWSTRTTFIINGSPAEGSVPGDATNDGSVDIMDLVSIIDYIVSDTSPASQANADANGDGTVDILDLVWIIDQIVGG